MLRFRVFSYCGESQGAIAPGGRNWNVVRYNPVPLGFWNILVASLGILHEPNDRGRECHT